MPGPFTFFEIVLVHRGFELHQSHGPFHDVTHRIVCTGDKAESFAFSNLFPMRVYDIAVGRDEQPAVLVA